MFKCKIGDTGGKVKRPGRALPVAGMNLSNREFIKFEETNFSKKQESRKISQIFRASPGQGRADRFEELTISYPKASA